MNPDRLLALYERIADAPDAVARLRRFILDLAVRGKLVPQDPEDEPAAELLNRTQADRVRLLETGEITKGQQLNSISTTEPLFELPCGWTWCRFGDLVLASDSGWSPRTENHARQGNAWGVLKVSAVSWDRFDAAANKQVLPGTKPRLQAQVHKGDFLISRANTAELVARAVLVLEEPLNLMMSDKIVRLRLPRHCNHQFLKLINNYADFARAYYAANATGVSPSMKNVSRGVILELPLPLPPLAEQHRIVAKVDELMALCDRLEAARAQRESTRDRLAAASLARLNAPDPDPATFTDHARFTLDALPALTTRADQIKQIRQTILNLAVRGKLVPQDPTDEPASILLERIALTKGLKRRPTVTIDSESEPFSLPATWQWASLDQLIVFGPQNGISPKPTTREDAPKAITLTATTSGVFKGAHFKRVEANISNESDFWLTEGDLLFQRGNTREYVGIAAIYDGPPKTFLFPDLIMKVRVSEMVDIRFVHLASIAPPARAFLSENASGAQASMPKINQSTLISLPIPLPPLVEQHRIVAKVDELMALCDRLEASLATADSSRRRLLDALLHEALAPAMMDDSIESAEALARQDLSALA